MNKAFVREPDEPDDLKCPRCGAIGVPVSTATIAAHVRADAPGAHGASHAIGSTACFCPGAGCDVAYFDVHGATIPADRLTHRVYPKWATAPVCPCLGLTADDLEDDAARNDPTRVRAILEQARLDPQRCASLHPSGRPCSGESQRHYLRFRRV